MPTNAVKTERDERLWSKAKAQAKKQGKGDNHAYIMGIYQRMKNRKGGSKEAGFNAALSAAGLKTANIADWIRVNIQGKPTYDDAIAAPLWASGIVTGPALMHEAGNIPIRGGKWGWPAALLALGAADTGLGVKGVHDMYKEYR